VGVPDEADDDVCKDCQSHAEPIHACETHGSGVHCTSLPNGGQASTGLCPIKRIVSVSLIPILMDSARQSYGAASLTACSTGQSLAIGPSPTRRRARHTR